MNLIIDIGNTSAKLALFHEGQLVGDIIRTDNRTLAGLGAFVANASDSSSRFYIESETINKAILSSVVPITPQIQTALKYLPFKTLIFTEDTPLPIDKIYKYPKGMGVDRIAADVAAIILSEGCPVMVFDAGTCLTSEFLHPTEGLMGGTISPGFRLRLLSMHEHTAALPQIENTHPHPHLLGHDTTTSMISGAANSITFEIEGYVNRITAKYPDLKVFVTGGDTFSFDNLLKSRIIQDKLLLLRGLNYILEFNEP